MNYFFTADEHFSHTKIIEYCNRPFKSVEEMDDKIIKNHNEIVKNDDIVIHAGDFTLKHNADNYIRRLNGSHIFIRGSHDYWMDETYHEIWEKEINGIYVVVSHYPFRSWPRSFHGSINLHGHCHGKLEPLKKQLDIGVDTHDFYPYSFKEIEKYYKNEK